MVSGPESSRLSSRSSAVSNQSSGGHDATATANAKVPTEQELGALFDQAMKVQQQEGKRDKAISPEEQQKFLSAMKDPEFRSLLNDYMQEISDPKHRAETEQYLSQLENEQRVPEDKKLIKPVPGFVVKTKWSEGGSSSKDSKVFVNVCSSGKLQPPSSTKVAPSRVNDNKGGTSWHLPYSVGPERMESDKGGAPVVTYDVCFHTRTLELAKVQRQFHEMVVKICLDAVENLLRDSRRAPNGDLSRKYHVLRGVSYKSGDPVTMCLRKPAAPADNSKTKSISDKKTSKTDSKAARSNQDEPQHSQGSKKQKPKATSAGNQQDVIDVVVPDPRASTGSTADNLLEMKEDTEPLLREVATTKKTSTNEVKRNRKLRFQMIYRGKFELMHHMQAEHDNVVPADRNRPKELVIEVEFPLATGAKGINLDVSETVVRVGAEHYDALSIPLPYPVVEAKGSAKFDKKQHKLVVTLPVQPPPPPAPKSISIVVEEEDEEDDEGQHEEHRPDRSARLSRPQVASTVRVTPPAPKNDEFQMLRETALMVANDPLMMARTASQSTRPSAKAEVVYDDMPPLESCSEDEDENDDDGPNVPKDEEPASDKPGELGDLSNPPLSSAPADTEAAANTPAFTIKETSACVSFLIAVANVSSASVKLSFPSPMSMQLRFTASSTADHGSGADSEIKTYAMDVASLPHAVRPETAEVDVATENMVVILEKTTDKPASSKSGPASAPTASALPRPAPPTSASPFGSIDPVVRFQNDLLYELD